MKNKITIIKSVILCLSFVLCSNAISQENESLNIPLSNPGEAGKLVVHVISGSITVIGYDGDDVSVTTSGRGKSKSKHKRNKSSNGMKRVTANNMSYSVEEINNTVYVKRTPNNTKMDFEIKVPRNFSVDLKTMNNGSIVVDGVNGTHEVSNLNGDVKMSNVGGSVIADALNEGMVIEFRTVTEHTTMMFSSLNGDIDITFPESLKANIKARSDNGNVYTDFEIVLDKISSSLKTSEKRGVYKVKRDKGITGKINGGGADMSFKTLNGDILIRSN